MIDRVVTARTGLHARPASLLARAVVELDAVVTLRRGQREANARGALSLLALDIEPGDTVVLIAEGPDAEAALELVSERLTTEPK